MTNEQNIIAVPVPVDAIPILRYRAFTTNCYLRDLNNMNALLHKLENCPENSAEFLGCVSFKDGEYIFDFDPSQLVQCISLPARLWKNYHGSTYWTDQCDSPEKSFVTRLQSMGHYWVNPLPYNPYSEAWIEAESKCLRPDQKLAIIKIGG